MSSALRVVHMRYDYLIHRALSKFRLTLSHQLHTPDIETSYFLNLVSVSTSNAGAVDLWLLCVIDAVFLSVHCLPAVLPSNSCEGFLWISGTFLLSAIYEPCC